MDIYTNVHESLFTDGTGTPDPNPIAMEIEFVHTNRDGNQILVPAKQTFVHRWNRNPRPQPNRDGNQICPYQSRWKSNLCSCEANLCSSMEQEPPTPTPDI